eukprot:141972_1
MGSCVTKTQERNAAQQNTQHTSICERPQNDYSDESVAICERPGDATRDICTETDIYRNHHRIDIANDYKLDDSELELKDRNSSTPSADMAKFKHYKKRKILYDIELVEWMRSNNTTFIVIDVRNTNMDYLGGHINGAINIEHINFITKLKQMIDTYYKVKNIVFHCMYSQCRGPMCCNWYCMALTALLNDYANAHNNDNINQDSFMKICLHESEDFNVLFDVEMDEEKYNHLCHQNIYVLHLGFVHFVNKYRDDKRLVVDFDASFWNKEKRSDTLIHKHDW